MPRTVDHYGSVVAFYDKEDEFGWMANTYRDRPVLINNIVWPTTEHYFQAMKFPGNTSEEIAYRKAILEYKGSFQKFPQFAQDKQAELKLARKWETWNGPMQADGAPKPVGAAALEGERHTVMREALRAKLEQHPDLLDELLALPLDSIIVEATGNDKKWGDGNNGSGTNHLGILYMEILQEFKGNLSKKEAKRKAYEDYKAFNEHRLKHHQGKSLYDPSFPLTPQAPSIGSPFSPKKNSATERVFQEFQKDGVSEVKIVRDYKMPEKYVVKLTFNTKEEARKFADNTQARRYGKTVMMGPDKAQYVFRERKIEKHGKKGRFRMIDALVFEYQPPQPAGKHSPAPSDSKKDDAPTKKPPPQKGTGKKEEKEAEEDEPAKHKPDKEASPSLKLTVKTTLPVADPEADPILGSYHPEKISLSPGDHGDDRHCHIITITTNDPVEQQKIFDQINQTYPSAITATTAARSGSSTPEKETTIVAMIRNAGGSYEDLDKKMEGLAGFFHFYNSNQNKDLPLCIGGPIELGTLIQMLDCCLATGQDFRFGNATAALTIQVGPEQSPIHIPNVRDGIPNSSRIQDTGVPEIDSKLAILRQQIEDRNTHTKTPLSSYNAQLITSIQELQQDANHKHNLREMTGLAEFKNYYVTAISRSNIQKDPHSAEDSMEGGAEYKKKGPEVDPLAAPEGVDEAEAEEPFAGLRLRNHN